ncbi:bacillithiol system redox-active protein YtxJ [Flavobacterium sp. XGLA_31]|uniref:bacillithiol system redox-active protein YtxJ n=1 Tax=Flavobacterium sp. XGLA_31 TaxID=3447666 RepID=UPI003F2AF2DF
MNLFKNIFGTSPSSETSKIGWKPLADTEQLDDLIQESETKPVLLFKHSTRCGISRMVLKQFESEFDLHDEVVPYFVDLLEYRSVSNEIAHRFEVEHQSPQLILIRKGKSIYDASHNDIMADDLKRYLTNC